MSDFDKKTDELFKRQREERASLNDRHEAIKASFVNDEPTGSVKVEIEQELERQNEKHAQEMKDHYSEILDIDSIEEKAEALDQEVDKFERSMDKFKNNMEDMDLEK